jgi:hypothetical protein
LLANTTQSAVPNPYGICQCFTNDGRHFQRSGWLRLIYRRGLEEGMLSVEFDI